MPRAKPLVGSLVGTQPVSGPSNELHVKVNRLYLVKVGSPPVVRVALAVKTSRHHLTNRVQVYVSFPGKDKRHDTLLDIGAIVEPFDATTIELDAEGVVVGRRQQQGNGATAPAGVGAQVQDVVNGHAVPVVHNIAPGAVVPALVVPVHSPKSSKRRKLNKDAPDPSASATPTGQLDPVAAGLLNSLHTPNSRLPSPEREHAAMTRVRNFDHVRFATFLIKTWYYSPYAFLIDEPAPSSQAAVQPLGSTTTTGKQAAALPQGKKRARESSLSIGHNRGAASPSVNAPSPALAAPPGTNATADRPRIKSVSELLGGAASKRSGGSSTAGDRLFVCYKCFKYFRSLQKSREHDVSPSYSFSEQYVEEKLTKKTACMLFEPPGRQVYQRPDSQFTIWEVDGAAAPLYCQNLSLFGKLFIDHKSVFFHVENFLFYIACINTTSQHQQPVAFFSKEKVSYDDYNLACIVTFPPWQKKYQLGRLLIEFSYLLTRHPATSSPTFSPGTPERPISDLGMKGYAAYWRSTVLRYLRNVYRALEAALPPAIAIARDDVEPDDFKKDAAEGLGKVASLEMTMKQLARAVHLTEDDTAWAMLDLGLVRKGERRARKRGEQVVVVNVQPVGDGAGPAQSRGGAGRQYGSRGTASDIRKSDQEETTAASATGPPPIEADEQSSSEDGDDDDDDAKHDQWTFDMSKAKIDALCLQYRVAEHPLLVESAVKL